MTASSSCPVCKAPLNFLPWDQEIPSMEICPTCKFHFGLDDVLDQMLPTGENREKVYIKYRLEWAKHGQLKF